MSDKDLLVVISEMLRKQGQHLEKLDQHTLLIKETNETLKRFNEVSADRFLQLSKFNEYIQKRFEN